MTINSVTSNSGLYEAMVQQAAALRTAQESRTPAARTAHSQTGRSSSTQAPIGTAPETDAFARSLSAQTRPTDQRSLPRAPVAQAEAQQFQRKVAGTYRSPWADANSLVVQTRSPGALAESTDRATAAPPPKPTAPKATFVEVHSVYVDAVEEESGRSGRNPLFQFAAQLYQDVVATGRRSAAGEFIGSSFNGVA